MTSASSPAKAPGGPPPSAIDDALPVADARRRIVHDLAPVAAVERISIRAALGRVLASDILSTIDVPAHDNSAMDGFAVRGADLSIAQGTTPEWIPFRIVGTAFAGQAYAGVLGAGEAVRIMTGALMPEGADTVVVQEVVRVEAGKVFVPRDQIAGQNRRIRGEDLAAGGVAIHAGRILSAADLGLLASLGLAEVPVRRRLRVAFFSTGNELRSIGEPLPPGHVYDSNRYTLFGLLSALGVEPIDLGVVRDDPMELEKAMRTAAGCADAILSSGGVSVGEADFTREVLARLGEVDFWTIAMRPGRPMAFGRIGESRYFGLPGNPVAVMITFYFLIKEALLVMMGANVAPQTPVRARSRAAMRKKPGRTEYQRGILSLGPDGCAEVHLSGSQGSGVLSSMSHANCIVVLHHEQAGVQAGEMVDCLPLHGLA